MKTGLEKIFRWSKSYIRCRLEGGDLERLFNLCHNNHIECWEIQNNDGICYCCIYVKDFWKIKNFIRKTGVKIRIEKRYGLGFTLLFFRRRYTLWMGLLLCVIILFVFTNRIWKIEFYGNSYYTDEKLTKYLLRNEDLYYGINKSKIDGTLLEENLRISFPDISWVSVRMEGTSLIINLEEMVKYDTDLSKEITKNIYADMDGEIVSMVTRSGTPCVTIGDEVHKGDLLIDGRITLSDESLAINEERMVGADGDIWAKVVVPYYKIYDLSKASEKFGHVICKWNIVFGNRTLSLGFEPKNDEQEHKYQHITEIRKLIPGIQLQKEIYRVRAPIHLLETVSEAKQKAEQELSDMFDEFYEKGVQILENNVKIIMYEDRVEASGDVILIRPIGMPEDELSGFMKNTENGEIYEYYGNSD